LKNEAYLKLLLEENQLEPLALVDRQTIVYKAPKNMRRKTAK
jgi:hypothetical protein